MTDRPDVLVVGGGVIGCSVAWNAASRGLRVSVVERATPGAAATSAAAGMLSPLGETQPASPLGTLALASYERYPAFVSRLQEATGMDVAYRESGKLHVAVSREEEAALERLASAAPPGAFMRLTGAEARAIEPALTGEVQAALRIERDARIDNRRLGHAAWHAAELAGVSFQLGRTVLSASRRSGEPFRVHLDDGSTFGAGAIVIAAGAWSGAIEGIQAPPVRPVRGQMLAVSASLLARTIHGHGCYLVPRDDARILIGATVEDAGFEPGPTPAGIRMLLESAIDLVPALADVPILETWAGYRPGTPDALPILGEDPDMPKLYWATGHYRNGILLAPITAEIIGRALVGEHTHDLAPFSIRRFRISKV